MSNNLEILSRIWRECDQSRPWMVDIDDTIARNEKRRAIITSSFKCMSQFDILTKREKMAIMSKASTSEDELTNFGHLYRVFTIFHDVSSVFVSARPNWLYQTTKTWLNKKGFEPSGVVVRRSAQMEMSSEEYKHSIAKILRPTIIIDDRHQASEVAREVGAEFLHVANGWE